MTNRGGEVTSGFTLIEVMLSIAIVASIAALTWGSFSLTARSKRRAEQISDRYHQVRLAMNRMAREISMAYLSKNDEVGTTNPRTMFVEKRQGSVDELMFSALAHVRLTEDAKESDQSVIRYFARSGTGSSRQTDLVRRESRRLGDERPGERGPTYVMLEDIRELRFDYFDAVADEWRESWTTLAADGQPDRLPDKVRITLTLSDERGEETTFRTATRIHLTDALWFSSSVL